MKNSDEKPVALPSSPTCPECGSRTRQEPYFVKDDPADVSAFYTPENSHTCTDRWHGKNSDAESVPSTPSPTCGKCQKPLVHAIHSPFRGDHAFMDTDRWARLPFMPVVLCCRVTGNICGSDPWIEGFQCQCEDCQEWLTHELGVPSTPVETASKWECAARKANTANDPQDCNWPFCGCDESAGKVIEALLECGWNPPNPRPSAKRRSYCHLCCQYFEGEPDLCGGCKRAEELESQLTHIKAKYERLRRNVMEESL